jgi:hypothetical protein
VLLICVKDWQAHLDRGRREILARRCATARTRRRNDGLHTVGYTATVFGATGFLGRYIVNRLGAWNCR